LIPPQEFSGTSEDWRQYEAPERLKAAIVQSEIRFDVLLCDEAQDVQPFWWEAFENLLRSKDESRFYIFFDRGQGVFGSIDGQKFIPEDVLPVKAPYFPLVSNYRTTAEIAALARAFRTGQRSLPSQSDRVGYLPELIEYTDAADARAQLARLMRKLTREEGLAIEEITLLSARNPSAKESVLFECEDIARFPLHRLHASTEGSLRGKLAVSTIASFKGLETPVGILLNLSEYNMPLSNPIMASLLYVACTRAKHMLYVFTQKGDEKSLVIAQAIKNIRTTGALVIDSAEESNELQGVVTHYDPLRLGWIEVEDRGGIMFFPYDVNRASLADLKVGQMIRFRPKRDGQVLIACDLRLLA
jgi:superfamily I DNA/RNA helicase